MTGCVLAPGRSGVDGRSAGRSSGGSDGHGPPITWRRYSHDEHATYAGVHLITPLLTAETETSERHVVVVYVGNESRTRERERPADAE